MIHQSQSEVRPRRRPMAVKVTSASSRRPTLQLRWSLCTATAPSPHLLLMGTDVMRPL